MDSFEQFKILEARVARTIEILDTAKRDCGLAREEAAALRKRNEELETENRNLEEKLKKKDDWQEQFQSRLLLVIEQLNKVDDAIEQPRPGGASLLREAKKLQIEEYPEPKPEPEQDEGEQPLPDSGSESESENDSDPAGGELDIF
jgi:predicted  nucleic acid-binding Zn-ribbon protein